MRQRLLILLVALRPKQWTKNALVLAAFFFGLGDPTQQLHGVDFWTALAAAGLFCLASGAVYLMNDLHDREQDRSHPVKCRRPIASGALAPRTAATVSVHLLGGSLLGGWLLEPCFAGVLALYIALQYLYTLRLKRLAGPDVLAIALGFLLRVLAGAVVLDIGISPWLLICTLLLSLFLALCKRRQEKLLHRQADLSRPSLSGYGRRFLDGAILATASATLGAYSLYTVWPDTVCKYGTWQLALTIPFVFFGLLRYVLLVFRNHLGERPEQVLLSDIPLMGAVAGYLLVAAWVLLGS
jgi:decaprenyl-phosphate phosphoribosyltransferase